MDGATGERDQAAAIREAALPFIRSALPALAEFHLYPRPPSNPFIHIGTDYFGSNPELPNFRPLGAAIEASHARFADDAPMHDRDFSTPYVYSFLEACVARLASSGDPWDLDREAVERSVDELVACVTHDEWEVACCRVVSHLTTVDGKTHQLGDIKVVPVDVPAHEHRHQLFQAVRAVIPGAGQVFRDPFDTPWAPPESVLIVRSSTPKPHEGTAQLSKTIGDFLLTARLLTGATAQSAYEIRGQTTVVCSHRPEMIRFGGQVGPDSRTQMVRRDLVLGPGDAAPIDGLRDLKAQAYTEKADMIVDPFGLALLRFNRSHYSESPYDQVIELVTALEAAMSGSNTDVLFRVRTRCACLLATPSDPAGAIFDDVGALYELRSKLIHGGEMKVQSLDKLMASLSGMPEGRMWAERLGDAVDRLRDLVRRSILVRICLGSGDKPIWPIGDDRGVDRALTDDETRSRWRNTWHDMLDAIGAPNAWERPAAAHSVLATFAKPTE